MRRDTCEGDGFELDAEEDGLLLTQEERDALVRDTLMYACMFPAGPEQDELRLIARTLSFFDVNPPHPDELPSNIPSTRPSLVDLGGVRIPVVLFEAIEQWAKVERMSRSDAFQFWLARAMRGERLGRN